ncbi:hypothetical protein NLI96_g1843 [Meripilus lineatus]|uniref:Uncharacterized protein n=1 Tax=Meripilus lineatus TaxID=2056292 RepID=A0AAD5YH36_9APHY|nr:hypothetical protein NLI96_g1843 [Physisporinus lineatus]
MACLQSPHNMAVDIIIEFLGHLRHVPGTLKQCSLVCKPWLYPSQKHLFGTMQIKTHLMKQDFHHILQFLDQYPHVSSFVKHLVFTKDDREDEEISLELTQFHEVISHFPALTSVEIQDLNVVVHATDTCNKNQLTRIIRRVPLPHIRSLLLDRVWTTPVDITYLLWLVSSVDTLRITDSESIAEPSSCHSPLAVDLGNLRHVQLSHSRLSSGLIRQLSKKAPDLYTVSIAERDPNVPDVSRTLIFPSSLALRRLCLDLKNVTVASDNDQHPMNVRNYLDLKSFYNLKELKLTVEMACVDAGGHNPSLQIQWTLLLGLVESSQASHIVICLSPPQLEMGSMGGPYMKRLKCPLLDDWWAVLKGQAWPLLDGCLTSKASIPELGFMGETFCLFTPFCTQEYLGNMLEENIRSSLPRMSSLGRIVFWNEDKDSETHWYS